MHSFSKFAGVIAISLAMILAVFGTRTVKASDNCNSCSTHIVKTHTCNTCEVRMKPIEPVATCGGCVSSCKDQAHARHEAAEDQARAEQARKKAADKAADLRARADQAEQDGAKEAAEYEAKANAHLESAGLLCPAPSSTTIVPAQ
jgi:hypothetical protein